MRVLIRRFFFIAILLCSFPAIGGWFGTVDRSFFKEQISDCDSSEIKLITSGCKIDLSKMSAVTFKYLAEDGSTRGDGLIVIRNYLADSVIEIFKHLFQMGFVVMKTTSDNLPKSFSYGDLIHRFGALGLFCGDDFGLFDTRLSNKFGISLDLNVNINPYIIRTAKNSAYIIGEMKNISRESLEVSGAIDSKIVDLFARYGFTEWGGNKEFRSKYGDSLLLFGRFSVHEDIVEILEEIGDMDAPRFMKMLHENPSLTQKIINGNMCDDLILLYKNDPSSFFRALQKHIKKNWDGSANNLIFDIYADLAIGELNN